MNKTQLNAVAKLVNPTYVDKVTILSTLPKHLKRKWARCAKTGQLEPLRSFWQTGHVLIIIAHVHGTTLAVIDHNGTTLTATSYDASDINGYLLKL